MDLECKETWFCIPSFRQFLTIHLKSVGLKKFLVAIGMTGVVGHVGRGHLGDIQRAIISKVLPKGESEKGKKKKKNS